MASREESVCSCFAKLARVLVRRVCLRDGIFRQVWMSGYVRFV